MGPSLNEQEGRASRRVTGRSRKAPGWLARARTVGDPEVDLLVAKLASSKDAAILDDQIARLARDPLESPRDLPPALRQFLRDQSLPEWADRARLRRASLFAERHSVAIACALFCASLPSAFTAAKGVGVLRATGRLEGDIDRRVNETGRFVFDVMMPGGFESGAAIRSAQCVRLMHAAVRVRVLRGGGASGSEVPINQEDLLGTLVCFSVVVLDALDKMGVAVGHQDAEDFMHLWRVVGALLGIRPRWLPRDLAGARTLGACIHDRQSISSADGRALTTILIEAIERHVPARGLGLLVPGLVRFFLGEEAAESLGVPYGLRPLHVAAIVPRATGMLDRLTLGVALPGIGRTLLEHTMRLKLGPADPSFHRPLEAAACPVRGPLPARGRTT